MVILTTSTRRLKRKEVQRGARACAMEAAENNRVAAAGQAYIPISEWLASPLGVSDVRDGDVHVIVAESVTFAARKCYDGCEEEPCPTLP